MRNFPGNICFDYRFKKQYRIIFVVLVFSSDEAKDTVNTRAALHATRLTSHKSIITKVYD